MVKISDYMLQGLIENGSIQLSVLDLTSTLEDAVRRHGCDVLSTLALGRAMVGVALLGCNLKEDQQYLQLDFQGQGPLQGVVVEYIAPSVIRGFPQVNKIEASENLPQSVGEAIGKGTLNVKIGSLGNDKPYQSQVELVDGEIGSDLSHYLWISEQVTSIVAVSVKLDPHDGSILGCGGYIFKKIAGSDVLDEVFEKISERLKGFSVSEELADKKPLSEIYSHVAGTLVDIKGLTKKNLCFSCLCTVDNMKKIFSSIPEQDVTEIRKENEGTVGITCHFCNTTYKF